MAFESLTEEETASGAPGSEPLFRKIMENFDALNGAIGTISGNDIPNGSFEIDSDSDGQPDSWSRSLFPGGSGGRNDGGGAEGSACLQIVHPGGAGNGGGYYDSDYVPCSGVVPETIGMLHWASAAGMKNKVEVRFYDASKVYVGMATLYDSTDNPTSATQLILGFVPPSTSRFYKLRLIGGYTDTDVAGSALFDAVTRSPDRHGVLGTGRTFLTGMIEKTITVSGASFAKFAEFHVQSPGRVDLELYIVTAGQDLGVDIYINGVSTGRSAYHENKPAGTLIISDIAVQRGDKLQLYCYTGTSGAQTIEIRNVCLWSSRPAVVSAGITAPF